MLARLSMIMLSGAIGLSLTGCSATSPITRGQSPTASFTAWSNGQACQNNGGCDISGGPAAMSCDCHNGGWNAGDCYTGGSCPPGAACHNCQGCQDGTQCLNLPFHPVHRNFHTYDIPRDLTYPSDNCPTAMYQYPYYTTRGPTDFFME